MKMENGKPEDGQSRRNGAVNKDGSGGRGNAERRRPRPPERNRLRKADGSREDRRAPQARTRFEPTSPRWSKETGPKACRKCGGRMYPADWIWQQYGLCLGWRCARCKDKVLARSLPFKGLRKRKPDPDEIRDAIEAGGKESRSKSTG